MKNPRFLFWLIVVLTLLAFFVDLPRSPLTQGIFFGQFHLQKDISFKKGLDLEGGASITYKADMSAIPASQRASALEGAKTIIDKRVNLFGVSEPIIQTATVNGESRIIVELPGVSDINQATALIGTTAQLSFWEPRATASAALNIASSSALPAGIIEFLGPSAQKTNLSGRDLQQTNVTFDQNTGKPQVQLVFNQEGTKKFADITRRNTGKIVAIVLDNQVIEAPRVNEPILAGNAVITGGFTTEQAKALSVALNAGALPVPLLILEQRSIGATLGHESLQKSLFAALLGFSVIVIFMSVLYGRLGMLASLALVLYTLFVLALFKLIPVTLTLAGIAGFVLSVGMAVDANILIFERMGEEIRRGRTREVATELGFSRAWTSIRDSNVSSLITSAILYYFGTGAVRGFALTLAIGVLVSMFSAIVVTRTFLRLVFRN